MKQNLLLEIVDRYPLVWDNPRLIKALVLDYYPEEKLIRNLITACVEEQIPQDIYSHQSCSKTELFRYANKVVNAYGCSIDKAKEIVYLWAEALNINNLPSRRDLYPGHEKCEALRAIRKKIAEANNIIFEPTECTHEGPCRGTCPVCDAEIRYLDRELQRKKDRGEEINIDGIAETDIKRAHIDIPEDEEYITMGAPRMEPIADGGLDPFDEIEMGMDVPEWDDDLW